MFSTNNLKDDSRIPTETLKDCPGIDDLTLVLFGHAAFQFLNAGCELGVFELLSRAPGLSREDIGLRLNLEVQPMRSLLLGLTSLRLIVRNSDAYSNGSAIKTLFENGIWKEFCDTVRFEAEIVYSGQSELVSSLRENTNNGLRYIPGTSANLYQRLGENHNLQKVFYDYMSSWSKLANPLLLKHVDFGKMNRVLDVGGGDATNAIAIAEVFPDVRITVIDIPQNCEVAQSRVLARGLCDRIKVMSEDMFTCDFPLDQDCIMFIHQLVIWPLEINTELLTRAYKSLRPGGQVIIFNSMSSDTDDGPLMAALDSAYFMSIPSPGGMIYAWKDYEECLRKAGFSQIDRVQCKAWTPHGIITGTK